MSHYSLMALAGIVGIIIGLFILKIIFKILKW